MKAIVCPKYGSPDVLRYEDIAKPTPKDNEVLIRVHAASLNAADWHIMRGSPAWFRPMMGSLSSPTDKILGADVAGIVESVGSAVTQFKPGDAVYGDLSGCGRGSLAEYVCAREDTVILKPASLSFEEAAAVPLAAVTALQGLRDRGQIQAGQKVLINGASGGVGTFAVQLAKVFGAEVTAVCSTAKVEMVCSLGADHVIDYKKVDFTRLSERYDLIFAANGDRSVFDYRRALAPKGIYAMAGGSTRQFMELMFLGSFISRKNGKQSVLVMAKPNSADLLYLNDLLQSRRIIPVLDRCYPLDQAIEAVRYLDAGHATGKIIVTVAQGKA